MRLETIWIDNYKNLQDTSIDFRYEDSIVAIVGNNGTGKSNLIEALLDVFIGLYYDQTPIFGFRVVYVAHDKRVEVISEDGEEDMQISVNGYFWSRGRFNQHIRSASLLPPFPALVFGYYSGTCERVKKTARPL